ncbi:TIGR04282 family arsenosugar biosynthesis glycosyltransferase [Altericista sp. CCNU0014]|uniref:TIGR04282 family arsenosugar biosynthesis glycosyltransferase n=1 Tax=Altericista sp. CCNU0014 TaxID=3082949 RepID=UPI00384F2587
MTATGTVAKNCLMIFTRYPEPGQVKTRLIPALGAEGAATLHRRMVEHTLAQARALKSIGGLSVEVWFANGSIAQMQAWLGEDVAYQLQPEGDLGDRMALAFESAFAKGHQATTIIGTDCPDLSTAVLEQSFSALQQEALVLGPAIDGGYYLIGLARPVPELFTDIAWSTANVLQATVEKAARLGLTPHYLAQLSDIDLPEDLERDSVRAFLGSIAEVHPSK